MVSNIIFCFSPQQNKMSLSATVVEAELNSDVKLCEVANAKGISG